MKTKKLTPAEEAAQNFLAPVIDGTSAYGAKKRLAQQLSERTGEPVSRSTLERWIHKDSARRQQPLLGSGLLLREVFDKNNKHKRKEAK